MDYERNDEIGDHEEIYYNICSLPIVKEFLQERGYSVFEYVIIALSQPAPKYWGRSQRQLPIHSALLTYHDSHI